MYVWAPSHILTILALWIVFTHVYQRFRIAPRVALVSALPDSGKSVTRNVAQRLVFRPNPETLGTGAAVAEHMVEGPGSILLDELDQVDAGARKRLQRIWNLGHERGATDSSMVGGRKKLINIHAPMLAAGIGSFLAPSQKSRTFTLDMEQCTEETKPPREFDDTDVGDLDIVYTYLRSWAAKVKLDPKPPAPRGMINRFADNMRGLFSVADACGAEWGRRAREAAAFLLEKERVTHPKIVMIRHGLLIFEVLEIDQIKSTQFNTELKRLDLPDARWTQYRGAHGSDYAHPLRMDEQATLLSLVGIESEYCRSPGGGDEQKNFAATNEPRSRRRPVNTVSRCQTKPSAGAASCGWYPHPIRPWHTCHAWHGESVPPRRRTAR
jgi:hypothetical protein